MKIKCLYIIMAVLTISCQKEKLEIIEAPQEEASFLLDQQLTGLIKSVAAHDGSFDDIVDKSSCFSIDLPYEIELNGTLHQVKTVEDLRSIKETDKIVPVYPINLNFANYDQQEITTQVAFEQLITSCSDNILFNDRITCIDFEYPITIQIFKTESSDFETLIFDHDKLTFQSILSFTENELATIVFPISLIDINGVSRVIESNDDLKLLIVRQVPICE